MRTHKTATPGAAVVCRGSASRVPQCPCRWHRPPLCGRPPVGAPAEVRGRSMARPGVYTSDDDGVLVSLDPEVAAYLQRVAWEVVWGWEG